MTIVVPDRDSQRYAHRAGIGSAAAGPFLLARERGKLMSSVTFPYALTEQQVAELKAHHLACSHLVRGCQDAIFRFRSRAGDDVESDGVSYRTIEILEGIMDSWCETLSILRLALDRDSSHGESYGLGVSVYADVISQDSANDNALREVGLRQYRLNMGTFLDRRREGAS